MRADFTELLRRHQAAIALGLLLAFLHTALNPLATFAAVVNIDPAVHTNAVTHNGTTFTVVFTSDQTGYAFLRDADGTCGYRKTTNGGTSWSTSTIAIDPQTDCIRIAVWYERWTPGNSTGTKIHVLTLDTSQDDMWYTYLDTANDSTTSTVSISGSITGTYAAGANLQSLTMTANGALFAGVHDAQGSHILRCTSNCTAGSSTWPETSPSSTLDNANDWLLLMPMGSSSDALAVRFDISTDDVESKIWTAASSSWEANWTDIDTNCANNTTYDGHFGATLNENRGDIYLAYGCGMQVIDGDDDDIRAATFAASSRTWTNNSDAITNTTSGLTGVKVGLDSNTGNIYVVYSSRPDGSTAANVYYKISTSSMSNWGLEQGPLNTTATDIYGLRIEGLNDERLYATWVDGASSTLEGNTVADLTQTSYTQTSYKFFANQNATSVGTEFDFQDTPVTMANQGTPFRLRLLIKASGEGADVGLANFRLQIATSTPGGCDTGFSGETYADIATSTGDVRFYDNSIPLDGANLSATSTDPTDGTSTIVNQTYEENATFSNSRAKFLGGENAKWDFALVDNSAPDLQTYCIRAVEDDGSPLAGYDRIVEMRKNKAPTIGTIYLNRNLDIALTEGTSTPIRATSTATDENGFGDLYNASVRIHRSGVSSTCALDDNNCYEDQFCALTNCGGNSCELQCDVNIWFHADPTDVGTPWASENWVADIFLEDDRGATTTASSTTPVEVLTSLGLDVTASISYGALWVGSTTDPLSHVVGVTSTGNASMDLNIYGANMTLGSNSISINAQKFATSSVGYNSSTAFTATSTPGETVNFNVPKSISTTTRATSTSFWGIRIPSSTVSGNYTGTNTFIGVVNSLPWP